MAKKDKCDVCGSTKDVQCEIMVKGTQVDRIYHFCPEHWVEVYRRTLEDFVEQNQYKANSYIKGVADSLIANRISEDKMPSYQDEEQVIDLEKTNARKVRVLRPYEVEED